MLTTFADGFSGSGSGTENDPYQITNAVHLNQIRNFLNQKVYFKLMNDIDLTEFLEEENPSQGWLPMGDYISTNYFKGVLDGNGKTIKGLWIKRPSSECVGIFTSMHDATIKDLTIEAADIECSSGGIIAGTCVGYTTITGCTISGVVKGNSYLGGYVGQLNLKSDGTYYYNSDCNLSNNIAKVSVLGTGESVGGFAGYVSAHPIMSNCFIYDGVVRGTNSVGGLFGKVAGRFTNFGVWVEITHCGYNGEITGTSNVGGLIGYIKHDEKFYKKNSSLKNSFSISNINATGDNIGGLIGYDYGYNNSNDLDRGTNIDNNYYCGSVKGANNVGGIVGYKKREEITSCLATGSVSGSSYVGGIMGKTEYATVIKNVAIDTQVTATVSCARRIGIGASGSPGTPNENKAYNKVVVTEQGVVQDIVDGNQNGTGVGAFTLKEKATYVAMGFDFNNVWEISDGEGYPYIIGSEQIWPGDRKDLSNLTISPIAAVTYNGSAQTPAITIIDGTTTLTDGTDYTASYTNNINVGTATVTITGKGNYTGTKTATFTIQKAPLTITAKSYTIKQGDALPTFEATYSGFMNGETANVLSTQPTIRTTATSASEPGTYDIVVSGASATNYDITYVKGILTITQADPVTVTAKSYSRKYGEKNPTFEYTTSGATLKGIPSISCSATATSPVGDYLIVITKGSVTNYNDHYVNGVLSITKAPLTITAKSYTIMQGDALPSFEVVYSEFKNGETASVLSTQPIITTTATSESAPGTYDIVVSGASATNYDITYVKGTLTIVQAAPVIVTAMSYSRKYGEENPTFEYLSEGATLTGTPEITCEATVTSPVGEYPIVISKGTVTNYNDHYVNGLLTITKAPLTITAKSYTIKQGDALPTFEAEYAGFKNNETSAVLTTQPTIKTTATSASAPGTYDIVVTGAEAQNYEITYVKGTLTIDEGGINGVYYEFNGDEAIVVANPYKYRGNVVIPASVNYNNKEYIVTRIGNNAFSGCSGLTSVTIPSSVTSIGSKVFQNCIGLQKIIVKDLAAWCRVSIADVIENAHHLYLDDNTEITDLVIPDGVTNIGNNVFSGCSSLSSVIISNSVTNIGSGAFFNCSGLTSAIIGNNVMNIEGYSFYGCSGLTSIELPSSVTSIDGYAFNGCSSLVSVKIYAKTPPSARYTPFPTNQAITLYVPRGSKAAYETADVWKYFSSIVEFSDIISGDANGDGEVNVSDIVEIVNYIMNKPSDKFVFAAADLNEDGEVNVTDIVKVVSIIMSSGSNAPRRASVTGVVDNDQLTLAVSDKSLSLCLDNEAQYVASQFDIVLSAGQTLESIQLNSKRMDNHQVIYAKIADNRYKVVIYSLNNAAYKGQSGELLNIKVAGSGDVSVEDILFVTAGQMEKNFPPLRRGTTGISLTTNEAETMDIYSIDGRLVRKQAESTEGLKKGLYIINGKKQIVK